jgi:hypothetical protein
MPVIVPLAADPASLVSTHKTRHTGATVATVAIPATLAREPEFFQSAWDALAPLLLDIGQNLIEHQGFQAAGEVRIPRSPVTLRKTVSESPWVQRCRAQKYPHSQSLGKRRHLA